MEAEALTDAPSPILAAREPRPVEVGTILAVSAHFSGRTVVAEVHRDAPSAAGAPRTVAPADGACVPPPEVVGERGVRWASLVTLAFLAVGLVGILNHELWHDETQAWLIAVHSDSVPSLLAKLRYEGHPAVWYLFLYALSRFTADPLAMQLGHLAIAGASAFVVLRYAPFPRVWRVLLVFGYYAVYEYAVISRSYGTGVLLAFVACALIARAGRRGGGYLGVAVALALMVNVSVLSALVAMAFAAGLVADRLRPGAGGGLMPRRVPAWNVALAGGIVAVACVVSFLTIRPAEDALLRGTEGNPVPVKFERATQARRVARAVVRVWESYVPVPKVWQDDLWNTNVLGGVGWPGTLTAGVVSVAIVVIATRILGRRRPGVAAMYLVGTGALVLFFILFRSGWLRHHGHLFVLFVACLWLSRLPGAEGGAFDRRRANVSGASRRGSPFVVGLLVVQCVAGLGMLALDVVRPFSRSRDVARLLSDPAWSDAVIVSADHRLTPVSAYLDQPLFFASRRADVTYAVLARGMRRAATNEQLLSLAGDLTATGERVVILTADPIGLAATGMSTTRAEDRPRAVRVELVAELRGSMAESENYFVYTASPASASDGPAERTVSYE